MTASPDALLQKAVGLHRAGRFADAAEAWREILACKPGFAEGHVNLGNALAAQGCHQDAIASYRAALTLRCPFPEADYNLGNALKNLGRLNEAIVCYRAALRARPDFAAALYNLGNTLREAGRREEAIAAFRRAIAVKADFAQAYGNLGTLLYEDGNLKDAEAALRRATALAPAYAEAHHNLGQVLHNSGRADAAEMAYRAALRARPDYAQALEHLAALLMEKDRLEEAFVLFEQRAKLPYDNAGVPSAHRQTHDAEQAAHRGRPVGAAVEIEGGGRLAGPAINLRNDIAGIETAWQTRRPQVVVIDDLLTPEALARMRRFCWNSTIWRDDFADGYLGTRLQTGFACPLVAQVARELAEAYSAIFEGHPLLFAWAFKYQQGMGGTRVHADFAAVNVNFWITPDDANADPDTGGLVVWDVAAPLDWAFGKYNTDQGAIRAFLAREGARPLRIPYRTNRAVIFDSDLFHETDRMAFRPGYTNRRINVTLLYGHREGVGAR